MVEYINTENFKAWLIDVLKPEYWFDTESVFDKWCESALDSYFNSGSPGIEVEQWYTKSKRPECYSFDIETIYDEEYDSYDYKVIF